MAKELINVGKRCGLDAVKFQLFPNTPYYIKSGNVALPHDDFKNLVIYGKSIGIEVFASVFDLQSYKTVAKLCKSIKFSYKSCAYKLIPKAVQHFKPENIYVSGDIMNQPPEHLQRLYCISQYPVQHKIDFDGIFKRFDGFSDHTLGISQTLEAVRCGARIIEKHFRLDNYKCDNIPDGKFAIRPYLLEKLCEKVK
jgi:sialic acid synthase SpsE